MTKIYLIRHAEAEGNIFRRAHGHYNGLVTARGRQQIEKLRLRFIEEKIDAVYTSDLSRAYDTSLALSEPHNLKSIKTDRLREVSMGVWEDLAWGEIEYKYAKMNRLFNFDPEKWMIDEAESYDDVKSRVFEFITDVAKKHEGETIACFSHGFAIRTLLCFIKNIPSEKTHEMPYCDNTAVSCISYDGDKLSVLYFGDNSHLSDDISTFAHQKWWRSDGEKISQSIRFMPLYEVATEKPLKIFGQKIGVRAQTDKQYAAFFQDRPVGILGLDTRKGKDKKIGYICYLHVIPSARNKTFGTQLLGQAISDFRNRGFEKACISMPPKSSGINFMSKYGFTEIERNKEFSLMEKDIRN